LQAPFWFDGRTAGVLDGRCMLAGRTLEFGGMADLSGDAEMVADGPLHAVVSGGPKRGYLWNAVAATPWGNVVTEGFSTPSFHVTGLAMGRQIAIPGLPPRVDVEAAVAGVPSDLWVDYTLSGAYGSLAQGAVEALG